MCRQNIGGRDMFVAILLVAFGMSLLYSMNEAMMNDEWEEKELDAS